MARKLRLSRARAERGMTLLEVLVALAIFAFSALALIKAVSDTASGAGYLQDKTFAHWVALNRLAEVQLSQEFPSTGNRSGEAEMVGRTWFWTETVKETTDKDLRRVEISVKNSAEAQGALDTITGFVGRSGRSQK